jgi:hypothetical protein
MLPGLSTVGVRQYFHLPFKSVSSHAGGHVVFHGYQGHVPQSRISQF